MLETLLFALVSLAPPDPSLTLVGSASALKWTSSPIYQPVDRAVDNWRLESAINLDLSPTPALTVAFGGDLPQTPRCVKLNNYWCIKRAGWNGEIASDSDGHVAFASALEGAAVAALLLRRYYVELGRHSARAIVARWAPAQCSSPVVIVARAAGVPASRASVPGMLPQRVVPMGLAPRGIQNTVRARWLASHGRGGVARLAKKARRSKLTMVATARGVDDLMRAPTIAEGMGEPPNKRSDVRPSFEPGLSLLDKSKPEPSPPSPAPAPGPSASCAGELARIANYAARVAEGVAKGPDDDLGLFSADGTPTENLVKVMANMAAVEIGPLRASDALVNLAVAQLRNPPPSDAAGR